MQTSLANADGDVAPLNGGTLACIVEELTQPMCPAEVAALKSGARIVRLNAANLLDKLHDPPLLRLLGRLYDGVIVPDSWDSSAAEIAQVTGVPILCQGQSR